MAQTSRPEPTGERIAKVMARAGLCSRREAEAWIAEGRVKVNDAVIASPALNIGLRDRVLVDGKPLPARERTRLFLYYKPCGLVTTNADPERRPTIFENLPKDLPRLISVGRLDLSTEGLLLLTNDGGLARALELPATGWLRRYRVRALGEVTQPALDALRDGITVDGVRYGAIEATLDRQQGSNVWLTFAIREGKNREVRNVLGALGLKVNRLIRLSFGPFQLGELEEGKVEEVKTRVLREQLGDKLARLAGVDFTAPVAMREVPAAAPERRPRRDRPAAASPPPASRSPQKGKARDSGRPRDRGEDREKAEKARDRDRGRSRERTKGSDKARGPERDRPPAKASRARDRGRSQQRRSGHAEPGARAMRESSDGPSRSGPTPSKPAARHSGPKRGPGGGKKRR